METQSPIYITRAGMDFSIFLVYLAVIFVTLRGLVPGLRAKPRLVVAGSLAVQIVVVVMVLFSNPSTRSERWLWNSENEYNMVSLVATMQFALVGFAGLMTCWIAAGRPAWQRAFFALVGILFLFFTVDEYYDLRGWSGSWSIYYSALGMALVLASGLVAWRSPRRTRKWYVGFVTGLGLSAVGAMVLDNMPWTCDIIGPWKVGVDRCLDLWRLEELLEIIGVWIALVAICGLYSDARRAGGGQAPRIFYLAPLAFILLVSFPSLRSTLELRLMTRPLQVLFESKVLLEAMRLEYDADAVELKLFVSAPEWKKFDGLGYSLHLVDQVSNQSVSSLDDNISRREAWTAALFDPHSRFSQSMRVNISPTVPANRAMWLVLTLWREEDGQFSRRKIISSGHHLLSDSQVILDEFVIKSKSETDAATTLATFDNGFALEAVELPACFEPGETVDVNFAWRANSAGGEDFAQFLHFIHAETGALWNHDQLPLGSRLPTRLWYSGLADSEMWRFSLPSDLPTGEYSLFTGLYRYSDLERARAHSPDGSIFPEGRIPLGSMPIQKVC